MHRRRKLLSVLMLVILLAFTFRTRAYAFDGRGDRVIMEKGEWAGC